MIIAVNINRALASGLSIQNATERAWALSIDNCKKHEYVIGVVSGAVVGYFKLNNVIQDSQLPNRVKFDLIPCTGTDIQLIDDYISSNNISLDYIQRGKYI
jgi:hypothetical protein